MTKAPSSPVARWQLAAFAAVVAVIVAPGLVTQGLGLDGLVYANIALLFNSGAGSFWEMPFYLATGSETFSHSSSPVFSDHPPLAITMLAAVFRVFGDSFQVEKIYSLVLGLAAAALIAVLYRRAACNAATSAPVWWPLALWLVMPATLDVIQNNYLELPLTVCVLLATLFAGEACVRLSSKRYPSAAAWCCLSGAATAAAVLCKGPVGLVGLATVPVLFLSNGLSNGISTTRNGQPVTRSTVTRSTVTAMAAGAITLAACVLVLATACSSDDAQAFVQRYWHTQVQPSIDGTRPPEFGRLWLVGQTLYNLAFASALGFAVLIAHRYRSERTNPAQTIRTQRARHAAPWWLLGLCASIPLLVSARQYFHYLYPSLAFFAIAIAILVPPPPLPSFTLRTWRAATALLLAIAVGVGTAQSGAYRHEEDQQAAALVHATLASGVASGVASGAASGAASADRQPNAMQTVAFCPGLPRELRLEAYLFRNHRIRSWHPGKTAAAGKPRNPPSGPVICAQNLRLGGLPLSDSLRIYPSRTYTQDTPAQMDPLPL